MPRLMRSPLSAALLALAAPLLAGCGGTGQDAPTTKVAGKSPAKQADAGTTAVTQDPVPASGIVPNQQVAVVKEEIKGGEATGGPTPFDYLWQPTQGEPTDEVVEVEVPAGLPSLTTGVNVPAHNPITKAKLELGKQLYYDQRISKNSTVSCATCHNPDKGWTDHMPTSAGIGGQFGGRNSPTVLNTVYGKSMFWDGRSPSLEGQAQGPIQNKIEMGDQTYKEIVTRLRTIPGYQAQFKKVFGTEVTLDGMAKAIATFERTALSGNSAYDKYQNGDYKALTEAEKRGMVLFGLQQPPDDDQKVAATLKKAQCTSCHVGSNFTDEQFHNIGVGYDEKAKQFADLGRWAISPIGAKFQSELGSFKTPTIRDIVNTYPYMHNGAEKTLEEVVEYYNRGGNANPTLDKDMKKLDLTAQEKADIVAFMKALTGQQVKVALPTLPPGADGKSPDPALALSPPSKAAAMNVHGAIAR